MQKIKDFFAHPQIQVALALGIGIIAQAYFYKRIYHIEVEGLAIALPGLIAVAWEAATHSKKNKNKKYMKTRYWIVAIFVANIISIIIPLFRLKNSF